MKDSPTQSVICFIRPISFKGLDIGPESVAQFGKVIDNAKLIFWNGPSGVFEMSKFAEGTISVMNKVCEATKRGVTTVIGMYIMIHGTRKAKCLLGLKVVKNS